VITGARIRILKEKPSVCGYTADRGLFQGYKLHGSRRARPEPYSAVKRRGFIFGAVIDKTF